MERKATQNSLNDTTYYFDSTCLKCINRLKSILLFLRFFNSHLKSLKFLKDQNFLTVDDCHSHILLFSYGLDKIDEARPEYDISP